MRKSLLALGVLVAGIAALLVPAQESFAAPKPTTAKSSSTARSATTVSRSSPSQMRNTAAAASVAQAKRSAMARKGTAVVHYIQARNPNWAVSGYMTFPRAVATRQALRYQGLSAHIHNTVTDGSYVHYGMVNWQTKGASTNSTVARAAAAQLRNLGMQARVVTKVFKF